MTFPADGEGNLCGWDVPDYPLLYYSSFSDPVINKNDVRQNGYVCDRVQGQERKSYSATQRKVSAAVKMTTPNMKFKYTIQFLKTIELDYFVGPQKIQKNNNSSK